MFYIYILKSQKDNSYYIGLTQDIDKRVNEHNFGKTRYTSLKRPWRLVYKEKFNTMSEAVKRERYLKKMKSKKYLEFLITRARSSTGRAAAF